MSVFQTQSKRVFFDTNIAIYCFDAGAPLKQARARELLAEGLASGLGVVSYQVLQEFCNVASNSKRLALSRERTMAFVEQVLAPMNKVGPDTMLFDHALKWQQETGYSFYDSLIVAAAQSAQCSCLYSEDMQHGRPLGSLRIVNPFLSTANEDSAPYQTPEHF